MTNIRNVNSPHWRSWLGPASRCLVPFNSFSEFNTLPTGKKQTVWFAFGEDRPTAAFAGVFVTGWRSTRKGKEGEVTADLYGFLTTDANAMVKPIHPKAMPVILTTEEGRDVWLRAPSSEARRCKGRCPMTRWRSLRGAARKTRRPRRIRLSSIRDPDAGVD